MDDVDASNLEVYLPVSTVGCYDTASLHECLDQVYGKIHTSSHKTCHCSITLLLENIADEVIYQLEFVLRDALPGMPELKEVQHSRVLTIAHLVSAGVGASFVYIINVVQMRRTALP